MKTRFILTTLAGAAFFICSPALAQGRGGGHGNGGLGGGMGGGHVGLGGGLGNGNAGGLGGSMGAGMGPSQRGLDVRAEGRLNSQGPDHAADRALERANANSVLRGDTTAGTDTVVEERRNGTFIRHRTNFRANSQGADNASARGIERSNMRSALHPRTTAAGTASVRNRGVGSTNFRANSQGAATASARAIARSNGRSALHPRATTTGSTSVRANARLNSRGPIHASARARTRVNANSVLYGTVRPTATTRTRRGR